MYEVLDQQQVGKEFDSQTKETMATQENRTNKTSTRNTGSTNNSITFQTISDLVQTGKQVGKKADC